MYKFNKIAKKKGYDDFASMSQHVLNACQYIDAENRSHLSDSIAQTDAKIEWKSNITKRNVATTRMANLLGIGHTIAKSEKIVYKDLNGKDQLGIIMESAGEKSLYSANHEGLSISREVLLDLNSVQLLDTICGQVDRHKGNIMVDTEKYEENGQTKYKIKSVKGIDNDMSFGNITYKMIQHVSRKQMVRFEDKDGLCHMKKLDKKLVEHLTSLTDEMVEYSMKDLLSKEEMAALLDRIHGVKKAIKRTLASKTGKDFLIDRNNISDNDAKAMRIQLSSKADKKITNMSVV